jgi:Tfp pilus assembly protein PilF
LAGIYYNLGNLSLAEQYLRAALSISPNNAELQNNLAALSR